MEVCTEGSIRKWLKEAGIWRGSSKRKSGDIDLSIMSRVPQHAEKRRSYAAKRSIGGSFALSSAALGPRTKTPF